VAVQRPTISDVAREAGVSKGAVSFALNGRGGVSEETRERILGVARGMGWQPSHRARSLAVSRAFAFGFVLARPPELIGSGPHFLSFVAGVESVLAPAGYALVLKVVPVGAGEEASYRRLAAEGRVDGVLVSDLRTNDPRIAYLEELSLPAVTLNRPDVRSPFPAVCLDDRVGIAQAVRHLVELGHVRIGHVSGPLEFLHGRSRCKAWAAAVEQAGLPPGPLVVSDFTAAGGAAATRGLLHRADAPSAIVYANDVMAIAGISMAQMLGLRVPDDLSVTGFDGTDLASHMQPPLTTISTNLFGWGQSAATTLLAGVGRGRLNDIPDVQCEPAQLQVRNSTAAAGHPNDRAPTLRRADPPASKAHNSFGGEAMKARGLLVAAVALTLGAATACGGGGGGSSTGGGAAKARGPISIWYSNNPQEVTWGNQVVAAWNAAHPTEKVSAQQIPAGKTSEEVIGAAITAGSEPCLIYNTSPASVPAFQQQGGLVSLSDFSDGASYIETRTGATGAQYKSPDGKFYQLPWKSNPVMIFYNKKEFAKAGLSTTAPPLSTYTDFLATAKKLVSSGAAKYAIYPAPSSEFFQSWFDFYPMYAAESGGKQLVEDKKATFDSPAGKAVAGLWQQLYAENLAGKEAYTGDSFADGTAAMASVGPWAIAVYAGKVDWGVVPVPTQQGSTGDQVPTFSDAKNIGMYASCKNRATAWDFLKFSTSVEQDGKLLQVTGQMPLRQGLAQQYVSYFAAHPQYKTFAAEAAHVVEVPNVPNSIEIWQTFRDAWSKSVIFGKEDPNQALSQAASKINDLASQ